MIGAEALRVHIEAKRCSEDAVCEAEWNNRVHRPLLDAIMKKPFLHGKVICSNI